MFGFFKKHTKSSEEVDAFLQESLEELGIMGDTINEAYQTTKSLSIFTAGPMSSRIYEIEDKLLGLKNLTPEQEIYRNLAFKYIESHKRVLRI